MKTKLYQIVLEQMNSNKYESLSKIAKQLDLYYYYQLEGYRLKKTKIDFLNWVENLSLSEFKKVLEWEKGLKLELSYHEIIELFLEVE